MSVIIKLAETKDEIDSVLCGRHKVYAEEEGYMTPKPDGRMYDRFDAYPNTGNFIAVCDGLAIGGIRFTESALNEAPCSHLYDFSPHIPYGESMLLTGSMLWVRQAYRTVSNLGGSLIFMIAQLAYSKSLPYIIAVINPKAVAFFKRTGFQILSEPMFDEIKQVYYLPAILDVKKEISKFPNFADYQQNRLLVAA